MSSDKRMNETPIENKIGRILKTRNMTVTTAESCTGGLVSGTLVNAEGISDVFKEGFVTYSNQAKEKMLHVSHETLENYGAVSKETAEEMARGAAKEANADAAIAVTGIAGPGGGTPQKPVGLVYIGCYINGKVIVKKCFFKGNREKIRNCSVKEALEILYCQLLVEDDDPDIVFTK